MKNLDLYKLWLVAFVLSSFCLAVSGRSSSKQVIAYPDNYWVIHHTAERDGKRSAFLDFSVNRNMFDHPDSGAIVYEVLVSTGEGQLLSARALKLTNHLGKKVKPLKSYRSKLTKHQVGALFSLTPGDYHLSIKVPSSRKRGEVFHQFDVKIGFAGDVNGDHKVDNTDVQSIQSEAGSSGSGNVHDVNRDGKVDAKDLELAGQNAGAGTNTFAVDLVNNSGETMYVGLFLPLTSGSSVTYQYWDFADNNAKALTGQDSLPMSPLAAGTTTFNLPFNYYNSGRFVFSKGSAVTSTVNADGSVTFPDQNTEETIFDFVEFTLKPSSNNNLNINTTIVDQFGFPIKLTLDPVDIGNPDGVGVEVDREDAVTSFHQNESGGAYSLCVVGGTRDGSFSADGVTRLLAPQHVLKKYKGDTSLTTTQQAHYDSLKTYFDSTILDSFKYLQDYSFDLFFARSFLSDSSGSGRASSLVTSQARAEADDSHTAIVHILNFANPISKIGAGWQVASPAAFAGASVVAYDGTNSTATSFTIQSNQPIPSLWLESMRFSADGTATGAKSFSKCVVDNGIDFSNTSSATLLDGKTIADLGKNGFGFGGGALNYTWIEGAGIDFLRVGDQQIGSNGFTIRAPTAIAAATNESFDLYLKPPPGSKSSSFSYSVDIQQPEPDFYRYKGKVITDYKIEKTYDTATIAAIYKYTATLALPDDVQQNLQLGMSVTSTSVTLPIDAQIESWDGPTGGVLVSHLKKFPIVTGKDLTFSNSSITQTYKCSISGPTKSDNPRYKFTLGSGLNTDGLYRGMKGKQGTSFEEVEVTKVVDETHFYVDSGAASITPGTLSSGVTFQWQKSDGSAESYTVLQFSGTNGQQDGETYQIFQPFFSTNATGTYPIAPPWLKGVTEPASQMVFGCDGVFADNGKLGKDESNEVAGQYPLNKAKNLIIGNLENQVVSALNRGHLPRQVTGISGTFGAVATKTIDGTSYHTSTVTVTEGQSSLGKLYVNMAVRGDNLPSTGLRIVGVDTGANTVQVISRKVFTAPTGTEDLKFEGVFLSGMGSITETSGTTAPYTATLTLQDGFNSDDLFPGMAILGAGITGAMTIKEITDDTTVQVQAPGQIGKTGSIGLSFAGFFPANGTWNHYAEFFGPISIDGKSYSFPFSDQGGYSSDTSVDNPTTLTITLEAWKKTSE